MPSTPEQELGKFIISNDTMSLKDLCRARGLSVTALQRFMKKYSIKAVTRWEQKLLNPPDDDLTEETIG